MCLYGVEGDTLNVVCYCRPMIFLPTPVGRYFALAFLAEHHSFRTGCMHCWFVCISSVIHTGGIPPCWCSYLKCRFISGRQFTPESKSHNDSNNKMTQCCWVCPEVSNVCSTWTWRHLVFLNIWRCKATQHIVTSQSAWIFSNTVVKKTSNLM